MTGEDLSSRKSSVLSYESIEVQKKMNFFNCFHCFWERIYSSVGSRKHSNGKVSN